ncbi:hypothetical protein PILCRDRAFT_96211 [Piloderma croceum F 1598]|uniref:PITH domain-containing protein n=1 Tax=Piloderma croceum (strain F 1598) TaxID=765440 RepID=A0A0C3G5T0_PILCF|nr:hypothetical protein PILCRDRAFT_96211 [Piloderma croceum F 1598]
MANGNNDSIAIIKPWSEREEVDKFAESGVDDQVIFHIPFTQVSRGESTPRHLRIYANHPNIINFADAETTTPQLNISLLEGEVVAAFASINSLSLFFSDSVGGDVSRIYYVGFRGDTQELRKDADTKLDIRAANAADASLVDRITEKTAGQQTTAR